MEIKQSTLHTNPACDGCKKVCKFRGLCVAEQEDIRELYGCNTAK